MAAQIEYTKVCKSNYDLMKKVKSSSGKSYYTVSLSLFDSLIRIVYN